MTIKIEQTIYEPVPTGRYSAKIVDIEETEAQFGPQLKFTFELPPDEDGENRTIFGWCSKKFSSKSKLYGWTRAALGGNSIDRSYMFNSDDLIGRKVTLSVTEEQGELGIVNKISSVIPYVNKTSGQDKPTQPPISEDW